ncbi:MULTISPECIES: LysM peptidoglycan-binding domain-containing protein [unclassified Vibrio]|uniref:LysM peptidoglycan-binding domain-containing protein n=1 Tax=unclassified Vibrio TaxID=2614977 RepID=UPI00159EAE3E|nr:MULTISPECIES: LysM peptidoglycan-binding domain-containing protein [unclassified Vibrio]NVN82438.1 LysM peptidoglycan-binding domain-containing protein [Vibrio sp. Scap16]QLE92982.1 LysM peptidoglycan-binding domain-containing protein [Vibrio sp. Scap24]
MRHLFPALSLICASISFTATAGNSEQPLTIKQGAPEAYVVVKGDTLWDISAMYLDSPWLWPRLWQVNPEIENPHLIYPGDKLSLVWINGEPVLSLKPVIKLSPKIRVSEKKAVPTVNEGLVLPYLQSDRLVEQQDIQSAQRVLGTSDEKRFLSGADRLFISGNQQHQKWGIYRAVETYQRQQPQASITSLRLVATARLKEVDAEFSSLQIDTQLQEVLLNDLVLPELGVDQVKLSTTFYPAPSAVGQFANILGSLDGSQYSAKNQVVVINKGSQDNLRQGSMFTLSESGAVVFGKQGEYSYKESATSDKVQLPSTSLGSLMVIRPYEYFSLALITQSSKPVSNDILAVSPLDLALTEEIKGTE